MNRLLAVGIALLCSMGLLGCFGQNEPAADVAGKDDSFQARLLEIANSYEAYQAVGTQLLWAPVDCRSPVLPEPAQPLFSASEDSTTHGRKLYWLFVKEIPASLNGGY